MKHALLDCKCSVDDYLGGSTTFHLNYPPGTDVEILTQCKQKCIDSPYFFVGENIFSNPPMATQIKSSARDYSTHRQIPRTDNHPTLLFATLGKAEPLISTAARQKFDLDL